MRYRQIIRWLREENPEALEQLWRSADAVRAEHVGHAVHFRGLIEFSNICRRHCTYCGLRSPNRNLRRYRLTHEQIMAAVFRTVEAGCGTVVLQSGEDEQSAPRAWVTELIHRIKEQTPLAVTLSLGERTPEDLAAWRRAGADRYLLKFETSIPRLYAHIHPSRPGQGHDRIALVGILKSLGYQVGSGVMVGIPGQTIESLARDLMLFAGMDLDMIALGPYLPNPETPLGAEAERIARRTNDQAPATALMTWKMIALARLMCPRANIPASTALATLDPEHGRDLALQRGANVIMPNMTDPAYRPDYAIYPGKACLQEDPHTYVQRLKQHIVSLGRTVGVGRGDAHPSSRHATLTAGA